MFFMAMLWKAFFFVHFLKFSFFCRFLTFLGSFIHFFSGFFSSLTLYWPQVTPFDVQTQFLASRLNDIEREKKSFLKIFICYDLRAIFGDFLRFYHFVHLLRSKTGLIGFVVTQNVFKKHREHTST